MPVTDFILVVYLSVPAACYFTEGWTPCQIFCRVFDHKSLKLFCWTHFNVGVLFLEMMKLHDDICSAWIKVDLHSANVSRANDALHWWMFCFQSTFDANQMFCLLNKFVIFTNQMAKQANCKLKKKQSPANCITRTTHIRWMEIHLYSCRTNIFK